MVILLFAGQALKKFNVDIVLLRRREVKIKVKNLPKLVPWIKVSPFDAELNSDSNGLVFMDGTYFSKKFLYENLFRRASSVVVAFHRYMVKCWF